MSSRWRGLHHSRSSELYHASPSPPPQPCSAPTPPPNPIASSLSLRRLHGPSPLALDPAVVAPARSLFADSRPPSFTLQLSHIVSRIIISREADIAVQLTHRLFTMTNKTLCDVRSAHLSSLVFPSFPCSVPYTLEAPLKQLLPVPEEELCMLVILLAGNFFPDSSLIYLYLHLQKALLGL